MNDQPFEPPAFPPYLDEPATDDRLARLADRSAARRAETAGRPVEGPEQGAAEREHQHGVAHRTERVPGERGGGVEAQVMTEVRGGARPRVPSQR